LSGRAVLAVLVGVVLASSVPAGAAPARRTFGPVIEDYARYEGQTRCRPKPKRGVKSFRRITMRAYPGTVDFGIGRECHIGGRSEHKEGRAWDWGGLDASIKADRRAARTMFRWLFATDEHGNPHAYARRLGIMYIQWNRRMWGSWSGEWRVYCEYNRRGKCKNEDGEVRNPHTDHVHFSFSWAGARKQTSFWNPELSYEPPPPEEPAP
jgi:hypothetical protein